MKKNETSPLTSAAADIMVKVIPRSSTNQIVMREGDSVTVKVTAPPVEGSANKVLVAFLAEKLRLPKGNIEIVSGKSSRLKRLKISGLTLEQVKALLRAPKTMP